jgi:hypothetical protein
MSTNWKKPSLFYWLLLSKFITLTSLYSGLLMLSTPLIVALQQSSNYVRKVYKSHVLMDLLRNIGWLVLIVMWLYFYLLKPVRTGLLSQDNRRFLHLHLKRESMSSSLETSWIINKWLPMFLSISTWLLKCEIVERF